MAKKDYYGILGVARNAGEKEIKQAYRRLARSYHPDVNPGDKLSEAKFKEINEAYEVLSNSEKRHKYDRFGDQWQYADQFAKTEQKARRGSGKKGIYNIFDFGGAGDFGNFFDNLHSDFGESPKAARRSSKARSVDYPVEVTLEEAYHGSKRTLELRVEEVCYVCGGSGMVRDKSRNRLCSACGGSGKLIKPKRIEVKIPPGVKDGSRIRIAGEGDLDHGGSKGDIYLEVKVLLHKIFERKEDDLKVEVSVPLLVAVLGGEVELPTIKGKIALKIPSGTQNGKVFRLAGQGMPHLGGSSRGNLLAEVKVVLPTNLTKQEKQIFEQLRALQS